MRECTPYGGKMAHASAGGRVAGGRGRLKSCPVGAKLVEAHGGMGGTRALRRAQGERGWGMVLAIDQLATAPTSVRAALVEAHGGKGALAPFDRLRANGGWGMVLAIDRLETPPTSVRADLVEGHGSKGGARALRQAQGERGWGMMLPLDQLETTPTSVRAELVEARRLNHRAGIAGAPGSRRNRRGQSLPPAARIASISAAMSATRRCHDPCVGEARKST